MDNLLIFLDRFLEYFICFAVFVTCILIACFLGIKERKAKNAKAEAVATNESENSEEE